MNEWNKLRRRAKIMQELYPVGTRVQLKQMDDPQAPPVGALGTVVGVDSIGTILVQWDIGSTLGVTDVDRVAKI